MLSSRHPRNPALAAIVLLGLWWWLSRRYATAVPAGGTPAWNRAATALGRWLPPLVATAAAAAAIGVAVTRGTFVAGGADSYGYVSQAHLWAEGRLVVDEPLLTDLEGITSKEASAPLGYHLTPDAGAIVPSFPPGFPMLMALFETIGGRQAVYAVVPVTAGLLVGLTFLLGRRVAGPGVGAAAAVIMAGSAPFIFHITAPPMSDVPAAVWWTLALLLMTYPSTAAAAGAGLAAGAAILTRPNLAPLAAIPLAVIAWPLLPRRIERPQMVRALVYALGAAAGSLAFALFNQALNGSPLRTGYGSLDGYYDIGNWRHNLARYTTWMVESHTPLIALALAAPLVLRERRRVAVAGVAFTLGVLASYLFYLRLEAWMFVRFMLPAFPVIFVLMCAVLSRALGRLPRPAAAAMLAVAALALTWYSVNDAWRRNAFDSSGERKYAIVGRYIDRRLPPRAAIITMQYSGSIRYYSGRATVRWDMMDPIRLDDTVQRLRETGYEPFILVEQTEIDEFRQRFSADTDLGRLDWTPVARLPLGDVRLFAAARVDAPTTETMQER